MVGHYSWGSAIPCEDQRRRTRRGPISSRVTHVAYNMHSRRLHSTQPSIMVLQLSIREPTCCARRNLRPLAHLFMVWGIVSDSIEHLTPEQLRHQRHRRLSVLAFAVHVPQRPAACMACITGSHNSHCCGFQTEHTETAPEELSGRQATKLEIRRQHSRCWLRIECCRVSFGLFESSHLHA
jgi:hypothetical protein